MRFAMPDVNRRGPASRFVSLPRTVLACALLRAFGPAAAQEQPPPEPPAPVEPIQLRSSPMLQEHIPDKVRRSLPSFFSGDRVYGHTDLETILEGNAVLRRGDMSVKADRLEYYQPDDLAKASGHVRINRAGNVYEGPAMELRLDAFEGFFTQPSYSFLQNEAHGEASRIDFVDDKRMVIHNATFTTCKRQPLPNWMPDWILRATRISVDNEDDVGRAEGAVLSFKDVPILPFPSMSFPLSDKRKSGLLPPTLGLDNVNGLEFTQPYYWNIAPNRDATFYPTLMSKRGVDFGGEFRYLEANYNGQLRLDYMPDDKLRERSRWGMAFLHHGVWDTGADNLGGVAVNLNLNRVSDDNYWKDFTRTTPSLTQRLLPNDIALTWAKGDWTASFRSLSWQTLQDVTSPITPPYDRFPQLAARYARENVDGYDFSLDADFTHFQADSTLTGQPNAQRSFALAQISRPFLAPAGFITPKLQLHATTYQFDAPLADGSTSATRVVPTFSLDSGLVFERDMQWFGRSFRQTLEPRAFYVYTPFRSQNTLPVYDTGATDFNFSSIYTENAFVGNDRIADNNLLTLGVTTRFLDPNTGAEAARFGIAQRFRFADQNVTLPGGTPVAERLSDVLLGASVNWDPKWSFDSTLQFNPKTDQSVRATVGGRYSPSDYRVVTAAYRFQRDSSEQLDVGWQWPLNDLWGDRGQDLGAGRGQGPGRWYSVGRLNYSLMDRKMVDSVIGLEYDAGCWLGRVVLERLQTSTSSANTHISFQIEFVGFSRLGVGGNPLRTLKENIPRYQYLREQTGSPSRFSNYD
jgi:LPS-assembly protein